MRLNQAPSSDPSGPLLPAGEKREQDFYALLKQIAEPVGTTCKNANGINERAAFSLFSPARRRWPEGSDEGVFAAYSNDREVRLP
ncbi:hypothetical protein AOG23_11170 [Rhizobium acidisoli]|nr:hypothetical protein AOG23_11170 [Rhizobium acidisoli]